MDELESLFEFKKASSLAIILPISDYRQFGQRFKCERCGKCCTDLSSGIKIGKSEMVRLAKLKGISKVDFRRRFTRDGVLQYPCPFYDKGCSIYEQRPNICRYFPLGRSMVKDGRVYLTASPFCPGILTLARSG